MTIKIIIFFIASLGIIWVSRASLRDPRAHGFYRFWAWEMILSLFLLNVDHWIVDPFSVVHIIAWIFLFASLVPLIWGVQLFRKKGSQNEQRDDPALFGFEKTSNLITSGIYHYIRHPLYSSLLFLCWGILFKKITLLSLFLAALATLFLFITARIEEGENIRYFGETYQAYMQETKMFIPFIF